MTRVVKGVSLHLVKNDFKFSLGKMFVIRKRKLWKPEFNKERSKCACLQNRNILDS